MAGQGEPSDPWVWGGLVLLAISSLAIVLLYRAAPQSVGEVRTRTWVATRPGAFAPWMAHAEARLETAEKASAAGSDSLALQAYTEAVKAGWQAREAASTAGQRAEATEVWARAMLGWAERLRISGARPGLRPDDEDLLRQALSRVRSVQAVPLSAPLKRRAEAMQSEIERQLRPGPLEWLPFPR